MAFITRPGGGGATSGQQAQQQSQSEATASPGSIAPTPPAPSFGGPFAGLERWFYQNIEQPVVGYVGTEVSPLYSDLGSIGSELSSELPLIESRLAAEGPELASIPGILAAVGGIAATLAQKIPQVRAAESDIRSALASGISGLESRFESGFSTLESDISGIAKETETSVMIALQPEISALSKIEGYAVDIAKEAPTVQLIEQQITGFPTELENFWDNYAMPDIRKALGEIQPELTALETDISNVSSKIKGIATELQNLPEEVVQYVEKGVDIELKKIWKKIELPALAIGGLALYKMFYPSCPNCKTAKPKHIKTPVI